MEEYRAVSILHNSKKLRNFQKPDTSIPFAQNRAGHLVLQSARPSEIASGYEASSEDERFISRQRLNITPTILNAKLMKFVFIAYSEFASTTDATTKTECLIAMLKYLLDLFKNEVNIAKCAAANVVKGGYRIRLEVQTQ